MKEKKIKRGSQKKTEGREEEDKRETERRRGEIRREKRRKREREREEVKDGGWGEVEVTVSQARLAISSPSNNSPSICSQPLKSTLTIHGQRPVRSRSDKPVT